MATDLVNATNEINAVVKTAWDANALVLTGGPTKLLYALIDGDNPPLDAQKKPWIKAWGRVSIMHAEADSISIGGRLYRNVGTVYVNVFIPLISYAAGLTALNLASRIRDAFAAHYKGASQDVEFSRIRIREASQDGTFAQVNVLSEFTWDQLNAR